MKRPPVLKPRLSGFKAEPTQNRSLKRIVQSLRNSSAEQKDRNSCLLWNVLGHKPRAHSINKENSYIETKSSRESLNYAKETLKKTILIADAYPRTLISVPTVRNSFYSAYENLQTELEKFETIKQDLALKNSKN